MSRIIALLLLLIAGGLSSPARAAEPPAPRWWRGNLHTHTLRSDGDQFPEVVANWYREHGYNFLSISDHDALDDSEKWINLADNAHAKRGGGEKVILDAYREQFGDEWVRTRQSDGKTLVRLRPMNEYRHLFETAGQFMLLRAQEVTWRRPHVHLCVANLTQAPKLSVAQGLGKDDTPKARIGATLAAIAAQEKATGQAMIVQLNHPNFTWALRAEDWMDIPELRFFEVYNGHGRTNSAGDGEHIGTERMWDIVLSMRLGVLGLEPVYAVATDDAHDYGGAGRTVSVPGRGWVQVRSRYLEPRSIFDAMQRGDFYAASGVTLEDFSVRDGVYTVAVRPEALVSYTIRFIGTRRGFDSSSEPARDADGKERPDLTRRYGDGIGQVFQETQGNSAAYRFVGDELYVRAKVISSKAKNDPNVPGAVEEAWLQPVRVAAPAPRE